MASIPGSCEAPIKIAPPENKPVETMPANFRPTSRLSNVRYFSIIAEVLRRL